MKLLGHAWVAVSAHPEGRRNLLILGSVLPEIMYYTKDHPFEFEEIHEGGDEVYKYLKSKKPDFADLGLGMLAHSVRAGADKYNLYESLSTLGYSGNKVDELRDKLSDVLGITYETAKTRAHSILELAVELRIIRENPDFITEFNQAIANKKVRRQVIEILSDCFEKSIEDVAKSVNELLNKAKPGYFKGASGLASLWVELSKEFDPPPNKEKLARLLQDLSKSYKGRDNIFLKECIAWTKNNLDSVVEHSV